VDNIKEILRHANGGEDHSGKIDKEEEKLGIKVKLHMKQPVFGLIAASGNPTIFNYFRMRYLFYLIAAMCQVCQKGGKERRGNHRDDGPRSQFT
jgi:hypothetical protein